MDRGDYDHFVYNARYGWGFKYVWFVKHGFRGRATIKGENIKSAVPLWFADDLHRRFTRLLVLDAGQFLRTIGPQIALDRNGFHSGIYFPRAGCYQIDATWPGGQWRAVFSAGQ